MNCAVLFLARSKQFCELRTVCVLPFIKNIRHCAFFVISEKLAITDKQCTRGDRRERRFIKLIFLFMCHLFVDRGRAVDMCLFELEPL